MQVARRCLFSLHHIPHRHLSTTFNNAETSHIRNIAVVAHIDSGKTTLTESILLESRYLSTPGSVDTGSTTTDFLPAERERGITIQSASIPVKWKQYTYNIIDTPGHADFGMEVESASRVVDGAVVLLDSVEGVEAQTKGVWRQLDRYDVPTRIMFLNKLDRPGASLHTSYLSLLAHRFHTQPIMLTIPIASFDPKDYLTAEPGIQGIVDLVNWEVWKYKENGTMCHPLPDTLEALEHDSPFPPSHPLLKHLISARTQLLEGLGMQSEALFDQLLALPSSPSAYLSVPSKTIMPYLREMTLRRAILPVVCGSALKHIGTNILLDYVGNLLANPRDVEQIAVSNASQVELLAWKVSWDKQRGWMTFVRVYSGTLSKGLSLQNVSRGERERVTKIMVLYASQPEEVNSLPTGSVGVLLGLKHTRTGDTLISSWGSSSVVTTTATLKEIVPPPAVISASVIPNSYSDLQPVQEALASLTRADPSVRVEEQEGQTLLCGLGALHLEIVEGRLRDEWGAQFHLGKRRVSYREGFAGPEISDVRTYETQVVGHTTVVQMSITLRALQNDEIDSGPWAGNIVIDANGIPFVSPDPTREPTTPSNYIAQGLSSSLYNSHHTGLPRSNLHITIHSYTLSENAPAYVLAGASATILREMLGKVGMGPILEPHVKVKVEVSEENIGKTVQDLTEHCGEILDLGTGAGTGTEWEAEPYPHDNLYVPPAWLTPCSALSGQGSTQVINPKCTVQAIAPLSQMLDYSSRLRALSGGHGTFEMSSEGFKEVGEARKYEILRELGRA